MLDVDCGQHRTGVMPDQKAVEFLSRSFAVCGLNPVGLHAYDGHIHASDPVEREKECEAAFAPVAALRDQLRVCRLPAKIMVLGGTPTFPFHARRPARNARQERGVLWDFGYSTRFLTSIFCTRRWC